MGKKKVNIPMVAALILFMLTMISVHLTGGLYARYTARATASDSARVAMWDVGAISEKPAVSIDCSTDDLDDIYQFTVTNNSEVTARYDVVVTFTEALGEGISFKLDNTKTPQTSDNKTFTFENVGQLNYGGDSAEHTLTFVAVSEDISEDISCDFTVTIDFEQID
jgi:hypothetical protein